VGPELFSIFVSDMDSGIECTLSKSAGDNKLCGEIDMLEGRDVIQRDLGRLERWACANLMKLNKAKQKVLRMDGGNPKHRYRLGGGWIESSPEKKNLDLERVAWRSCGYPLPESVQGQVGQGFEQPGLVEGVPAHGRGGGFG